MHFAGFLFTSSTPQSNKLRLDAGKTHEIFPVYRTYASSTVLLCPRQTGEPRINISSSPPSNKLSIGTAFNLTCIAWQTDDSQTKVEEVEWFNPQKKQIKNCQALGSSQMTCTLMVGALTNKNLGNYTCKASNDRPYCRTKEIQIIPRGK